MFSVLNRLLPRKGSSQQISLGIEIAPQGVAIAAVSGRGSAVSRVTACEFVACGHEEWLKVIESFVKQHGVKSASIHIALHPEYYSLMLIDSPDVPDEELSEAVKWRMNDLVSGSIDEYVVDAFRLPEDAYRGRMNMIYAAYVRREAISTIVKMCEELELNLADIGIAELARAELTLRDLTLDNLGVAFVNLEEKKGQIDLMENGHLYLSREIDIGYSMLDEGEQSDGLSLDNSSRVDGLALDIQRSLDYYESQLGKQGISRLFVMSGESLAASIYEKLSEILPIQVEEYELSESIILEAASLDAISQCYVAVGAALGGEDVAA